MVMQGRSGAICSLTMQKWRKKTQILSRSQLCEETDILAVLITQLIDILGHFPSFEILPLLPAFCTFPVP